MIRNYFKIAFRNLVKNKIYTFINIGGLAVGLSACLVIYLLVSFELSFESFQPDSERIYRITSVFKKSDGSIGVNAGLSSPMPKALREELTGIESLTACHIWYPRVTIPNDKNAAKNAAKVFRNDNNEVLVCEPQYFQIFKYEWLQGSTERALKAPNEVVLTEKKAEKYFGQIPLAQMMGRQVYYNDSLVATVTGIVKNLPKNTDFKFEDFISYKSIEAHNWRKEFQLDEWTNTNSSSMAFVKLHEKTDTSAIDAQISNFLKKHLDQKDKWNLGRSLALQPLSDIHFNATIGDNFSRQVDLNTLYGLLGIAAFLLLIAAINFINLSTAQSIHRVKEIGVRKVLGSSRKSLIIQLLCETFLITSIAVLLSVLFVKPILWAFADFVPKELDFDILQPQILLFLVFITVITSVLSGFYPAWVISSYTPVASLKNQVSNGQSRTAFFRKGLIVFQFTASQVFILGTIIVATQSKFMINRDMGFNKVGIVNFYTDWNELERGKKKVLIDKLNQIPEIELVSLGDKPAKNGFSTNQIIYNDGKTEIAMDVNRRAVDENYFKMYGLKTVAGRAIANSDSMKEFVINETYAKALGFKKPEQAIGKFLTRVGGKKNYKFPIVGVVEDFHLQSLREPIKPLFIVSENKWETAFNVKIRNNTQSMQGFTAVLAKMKTAYDEVYPNNLLEFEPVFLDETIAKFYEKEKRFAQILNTATAVAILISCMGLFGLVAFTTRQRTKEIGIRKVLGASVAGIMALLSKDFLKLVFIAIIIASPIAYYFMNQWLQDFAYKVDISWWIFALAGISALVIALVTVSYQAVRAALTNPVKSLKTE